MKSLRPFIRIVFATCVLAPVHSQADTLKDVMESKNYQRIERRGFGSSDLYDAKWFTPGTSYASVFTDARGGVLLLDWLGISGAGLTLGAIEARRFPEYVRGERELLTKDAKRIVVQVFVPHPKFRDTIEMGLIDAFVVLEPPKLKILYSKPISLPAEIKGMWYEHETGSCSIVVKSVQGSIINIQSPSCKSEADLVGLAQKLDFVRLAERLES